MNSISHRNAVLGLCAALTGGSSVLAQPARPWMDVRLGPDERARLVEREMTVDERVAMLHGPMALSFPKPPPAEAVGGAGYVPGVVRLGVPALQETDASLGVTNPGDIRAGDGGTPLPSGMAIASTFDPDVAFQGGAMVGREAWSKGFNVVLGGGSNLMRDPRNGRTFEYLGEDPLLAGTLAGEAVRGTQSQHVVSTVKHFALNDQETLRHSVNVRISEAAMRESDLLAFQIAIERGRPGSVMCAYNRINGPWACDHDMLLNKVLKGDWGYPGWVMSDWGAVPGVEAALHGLDQQSGDQLDAAIHFGEPLKAAVAAGKVPEARLSDMTRRILRSMFAAGLFDRPPVKTPVDRAASAALARRAAEEGIVLLRNERALLPLAASAKRIVVIGGHADAGVLSGGGSAQVVPPEGPGVRIPVAGEGELPATWRSMVFHPSSPLKALRAAAPEATVSFVDSSYPSAAAAAAREADVAIVFATQWTTEGADVPDLTLPDGQDQLIAAVAAANPNTVVVLETGGPVLMPWLDKVGAVLAAWYPGYRGGEAIANILTGKVNPSGRLPVTFPASEAQLPRPKIPGSGLSGRAMVDADYDIEGSDVGYRWFARQGLKPLFPFGHGLSYTRFAYANLAVSGGDGMSVTLDVANTGDRAGAAAPQVYLVSAAGRPVKRLIGFSKVMLKPGERRTVSMTIDPRLLGRFDAAAKGWRADAGVYRLAAGASSEDLPLTGETRMRALRLRP